MMTVAPPTAELPALVMEMRRRLREKRRAQATAEGRPPWCPWEPTPKQAEFLACGVLEAMYGGAAGGGKSACLLMAALQHADEPGYAALLLRRTYRDLALPGALMDMGDHWLGGTEAHWDRETYTWRFPSGATLTFGYLENERDKFRYQSSEFQFVGFDELTQFTESQYRYLFSRLRRKAGVGVPLRMRAASNPGGLGHEWVKGRFVDSHDLQRVFLPALLEDNPHLDREEYEHSLALLDPVTRQQLRWGDWAIRPEGPMFSRAWFEVVDAAPVQAERVRYWDKAGTAGGGDWTAGVRLARSPDGLFWVEDVTRGQWSALARERVIRQCAGLDGQDTAVWLEQEPGSGGKESAEATVRALAGYVVHAETVTGTKETRARPFAAQAEAGNVKLVRGDWNADYLEELCEFPLGGHDDQVDAVAGAFNKLALGGDGRETVVYLDVYEEISPF